MRRDGEAVVEGCDEDPVLGIGRAEPARAQEVQGGPVARALDPRGSQLVLAAVGHGCCRRVEERLLHPAPQRTAAHQERIEFGTGPGPRQDRHAHQAVVAEAVPRGEREHDRRAGQGPHLVLGAAPERRVELVRPLRELREARDLLVRGGADGHHEVQVAQVARHVGCAVAGLLADGFLLDELRPELVGLGGARAVEGPERRDRGRAVGRLLGQRDDHDAGRVGGNFHAHRGIVVEEDERIEREAHRRCELADQL